MSVKDDSNQLRIKVVTADNQYAKSFGRDGDLTNPPSECLVLLTAVVINPDGSPPQEGTKVYWKSDLTGNKVLFWSADALGNPIYDPPTSPTPDQGVSLTDEDGRAFILVAGRYTSIVTIIASLTSALEARAEQLVALPLGGSNYQVLAFAAFDNDGTLEIPILVPKNPDGKIKVADIDGSESQPDRQTGTMQASLPLVISGKGPGPVKGDQYVVWALSGSDKTGRGQLVQSITSWDGGDLYVPQTPYGLFSGTGDSLAYMFYGRGNGYYSQVYTFDFDGVPLARPDDVQLYTDPSLAPVMLNSGPDPSDEAGRPLIEPLPSPSQTLTYEDLDPDVQYLRFAIPAPQTVEGKDNYSAGDVIQPTIWLNGWSQDDKEATMQTRVLDFPTKYGSDFVKNFGSDNKTYLPIFIPKKFISGFGANSKGDGYMWIMYTYNGNNSQLPQTNGLYPTRIDFPGPRPNAISGGTRVSDWRVK